IEEYVSDQISKPRAIVSQKPRSDKYTSGLHILDPNNLKYGQWIGLLFLRISQKDRARYHSLVTQYTDPSASYIFGQRRLFIALPKNIDAFNDDWKRTPQPLSRRPPIALKRLIDTYSYALFGLHSTPPYHVKEAGI